MPPHRCPTQIQAASVTGWQGVFNSYTQYLWTVTEPTKTSMSRASHIGEEHPPWFIKPICTSQCFYEGRARNLGSRPAHHYQMSLILPETDAMVSYYHVWLNALTAIIENLTPLSPATRGCARHEVALGRHLWSASLSRELDGPATRGTRTPSALFWSCDITAWKPPRGCAVCDN